MMVYATLVVEDDLQLQIARKCVGELIAGHVSLTPILARGNAYIRRNMRAFNNASRYRPYVIVTDLDRAECPPSLVSEWMPFTANPSFLFNVAVREAEAWALADRTGFARFFGVSVNRITRDVEAIEDPKRYVVNLSRRSRHRLVRDGVVPQGTATVGNLYNTIMQDFVRSEWRVKQASRNSKSLKRFLEKLKGLRKHKVGKTVTSGNRYE